MQESCLFCGQEINQKNRSKEHVIPQWLLNYMGLDRKDVFIGTYVSALGTTQDSRKQGVRTLVQGMVCGDCNCGWMSRLEGEAKALFLALFEGRSLTVMHTGSLVLAAWVFKTLALYNVTSNYRPLILPRAFPTVRANGAPPPGYHIEIAYSPGEPRDRLRTLQSPISMALAVEVEGRGERSTHLLFNESCVLALQCGPLFFRVVGLPRTGIWIRTDEQRHEVVRLSPDGPHSFLWPIEPYSGALEEFQVTPSLRSFHTTTG